MGIFMPLIYCTTNQVYTYVIDYVNNYFCCIDVCYFPNKVNKKWIVAASENVCAWTRTTARLREVNVCPAKSAPNVGFWP